MSQQSALCRFLGFARLNDSMLSKQVKHSDLTTQNTCLDLKEMLISFSQDHTQINTQSKYKQCVRALQM